MSATIDKPCPFCGADVSKIKVISNVVWDGDSWGADSRAWAQCHICGAIGPHFSMVLHHFHQGRQEVSKNGTWKNGAIIKWNERAQ